MKDEKSWDSSHCLIGHPCKRCDPNICTFYKTYSLDKGQDEKENENERTTKGNERSNQ